MSAPRPKLDIDRTREQLLAEERAELARKAV